MPQLPDPVDTDKHEDQGFDALPAGWYVVEITDSEIRQSKAGDQALNFEYTIIEGDHSGRKVWQWLNLYHSKEKTRQIAKGQFSTMCRAAGKGGVVDNSDLLHGEVIQIKLTVSKSEEYGDGNDVKGWKAVGAGGSKSGGSNDPKPWEKAKATTAKTTKSKSKPEPDEVVESETKSAAEQAGDDMATGGGSYVPPWERG